MLGLIPSGASSALASGSGSWAPNPRWQVQLLAGAPARLRKRQSGEAQTLVYQGPTPCPRTKCRRNSAAEFPAFNRGVGGASPSGGTSARTAAAQRCGRGEFAVVAAPASGSRRGGAHGVGLGVRLRHRSLRPPRPIRRTLRGYNSSRRRGSITRMRPTRTGRNARRDRRLSGS